ncbi:hypothetical protein J19TS2_49260 [Cohnella xylanilytica]|uniref:hypothetical protein n=1 Tax=Cohnella xylanilytica TaxID=557555 RepID=UPI001B1CC8FF|nr:hypothetical protein [Cohnella xylanilytica]GIO15371.1 hypothetical protein J19TS2_49260 [Cohnella xylanilytica]
MNLFNHYKQRENHCTNILMSLLAMNETDLLRPFLEQLIPGAAELDYGDVRFLLFAEHPPAETKPFEVIVGVVPFPRKETEDTAPNPGSIPDAWIVGEHFTLLFEFKVTGSLNTAQFAAHRAKLSPNAREIEVTWKQVGEALRRLPARGTEKWLIEQFCEVIAELESPRPASGMPKQVISGRKAQPGEPFFVITGNKRLGMYTVDVVRPNAAAKRVLAYGTGIQASRRWIQDFIRRSEDPEAYMVEGDVVIDCCEDPDREKPAWNRWRLGTF